MRILWITNMLFPEAEKLLTGKGELKASGGWMLGAAEALLEQQNIDLYVLSVSSKVSKLERLKGEKIYYYILPLGKGNTRVNTEYNFHCKIIQKEVKPDIVHIHGTEYSHGHAYMRECGNKNVVISIQGMTSACYHYYCGGIETKEIIRNLTIKDIFRGSILQEKMKFKKRSAYESDMLQMTNHVIGRTSWDRAKTSAINPYVKYHFCNEVLRSEFYDGCIWSYDSCDKHTIFLSQAGYPIKGLHQLLKAMPLILRKYPNTIIRIAGNNIVKVDTFNEKLRLSGYGKYIIKLINNYKLQGKVFFLGNLNANEMKKEYLRSNVFVCPSSIENSPNSLGEAQILGVPCVGSYVGGVPDMIPNENCGKLYRFEEYELLAQCIIEIFDNSKYFNNYIMRMEALQRHDKKIMVKTLMNIYNSINDKIV